MTLFSRYQGGKVSSDEGLENFKDALKSQFHQIQSYKKVKKIITVIRNDCKIQLLFFSGMRHDKNGHMTSCIFA